MVTVGDLISLIEESIKWSEKVVNGYELVPRSIPNIDKDLSIAKKNLQILKEVLLFTKENNVSPSYIKNMYDKILKVIANDKEICAKLGLFVTTS
jgi:hypothetical protein